MMPLETLGIVGVGLVGGSIALAARERGLARKIVGISRQDQTLHIAQQRGMLDAGYRDFSPAFAHVDLAVVCTPVQFVAHAAQQLLSLSPRMLVSDVGSTKAGIVEAVEASGGDCARFVGSHPLAGSEKNGPQHARGDLFQGKVVFVTPTARSHAGTVDRVSEFWQELGGRVVRMPPDQHDHILARTSHVPHLAAYALASSLEARDMPYAGNGFRDTTRLAASDPQLWVDIVLSNRDHILSGLARVQGRLEQLCQAIEDRDEAALLAHFTEGRKVRHALGS